MSLKKKDMHYTLNLKEELLLLVNDPGVDQEMTVKQKDKLFWNESQGFGFLVFHNGQKIEHKL